MPTDTLEKPANVTLSEAVKQAAEHKPEFGETRFSVEGKRIYGELVSLFKLEPIVAEKIAKQAMSDVGAVLANAPAKVKVGKANSKGLATIADTSKLKGVALSNALQIVRALQWIIDAGKNGVSYGFTGWKLEGELQNYVDGLTAKAKADGLIK